MNDMSAGGEFTLPWAEQAEMAVLGGLMIDSEAYDAVIGHVSENDFYTQDHRLIFRAIHALIALKKPVDVITVGSWLKDGGHLEQISGGFSYISELQNKTSGTANIGLYAEAIQEKSIVRAVIAASKKMSDLAFAASGLSARQVLDQAQELLAQVDIKSRRGAGSFISLTDALNELMQQLDSGVQRDGVTLGFQDLDRLVNPLQPGQLIVVGARPAVGKTSFAVNVAQHVAINLNKTVGIFSMEMTSVELAVRVLGGTAGIASGRFRKHRLDDKHWDRITHAMAELAKANIRIDETAGLTIQEIVARARIESKRIGGFGLIVVDYVQLAHAEGRYDNRSVEIGAVTSGLKRLAKELNCPVIALSQLNRDSAKMNKKPTISELRDSGSIEADADTILLLHRDYVHTQKDEEEYDADVIVGKQRNGGIGTVPMDYDARFTRFFDHNTSPGRRQENARNYSGAKGE